MSLKVFDIQGRIIRELVSESQPAGGHQTVWNGFDTRGQAVSSGIYFYEVRFEYPSGNSAFKRDEMILLK